MRGVCPLLGIYDMPTSVRFYRDKLGFEIVSTSPVMGEDYFHWAMLRLGGAEIMLNDIYEFNEERPVPPDPARYEAHGDTTLYFGCPDVDSVFEQLQSRGVSVKRPTIAPYGMKQLYLRDPDGYRICLQWPAS